MPPSSARQRLARAALELFGRKGIAGTTTQEIARRARCSQAALYKSWESKEALARDLFLAAHRDLLKAMREGADLWVEPSERVLGGVKGFLRYSRRHPPEHALLFQVFHSDYARWLVGREKPSDLVIVEIEAGMARGRIPAGDPRLKAAMILGMAIRIVLFEKQNLLADDPAGTEAALVEAGGMVLDL